MEAVWRRYGILSARAWTLVWAFWLVVTHKFHPTFVLAVIVPTSLIAAYAAAFSISQLVLVPRPLSKSHWSLYGFYLATTMLALTGAALFIIRMSYAKLWGLDADPQWGMETLCH